MSLLTRFQDFQDLRTPRTQSEAGIEHLPWAQEPWWKSISGAVALTIGLLAVAFITAFVVVT